MRPWEFLALIGVWSLMALSSYGRARQSPPGSDERNVSLILVALLCTINVITFVAMLVKFVF